VEACSLRCKLLRSFVSQAAVRSLLVVVDPPRRDFPPHIEQILKPAHRQALFAQPTVELSMCAFCVGFPGWMCTNSIFRSTHHARKCRLVSSGLLSQRIACGSPRWATIAIQHPRHSPTGKAGVHFQGQTLPPGSIHHAQQHPVTNLHGYRRSHRRRDLRRLHH